MFQAIIDTASVKVGIQESMAIDLDLLVAGGSRAHFEISSVPWERARNNLVAPTCSNDVRAIPARVALSMHFL